MTSEPGRFIPLEDALRSFQATAEEIRAECQAGRVRAFFASPDEVLGLHVCVDDMRKNFKESTPAAETEKRSRFGSIVRWTAAAGGAGAVGWVGEEAVKAAWGFLRDHVFRSMPEPVPPVAAQREVQVSPHPPRIDRAALAGRDYCTREIAGGGSESPRQAGGHTPQAAPPGGGGRTGGFTTREGGAGGGFRMR